MTTCHPELAEGSLLPLQDPSTPLRSAQDDNAKILSISTLSLSHFRNYTSARLEVSPAPVILTGKNGAGKTNILEAISLLTPGRGLRRARLAELEYSPSPASAGEGRGGGESNSTISSRLTPSLTLPPIGGGDKTGWAIAATVSGMRGETKIGTGRDPDSPPFIPPASGGERGGEKRIVKIDGKISKGQAELARHMAILWLTPQMEQLFLDGASAGRKFLDRLVYSFDTEHASRINEYEFAMRERNKLLAIDRADAAWLEALEATMAETGAAIACARLLAAQHINHAIAASPLSFPKAHIKISGIIEDLVALGTPAVRAEEDFKSILKSGRQQDAAAGRTISGTHRSAMQVIHVEKQMPAESCSTGEQKALLLSIVLAQARAGRAWHGVIPVLLLDEIAAHLDATRRLELFEEICQIGAQVWMTGTDANLFAGIQEKAQFFMVENGTIL